MIRPPLQFQEVRHGTPEYGAMVGLRDAVLRRPLGLAFTPEQLAAEVADRHLACFQNGALVACLILSDRGDGRVQMRQVAVRPDAQGQGIGQALVQYAESMARDLGYREMILHARETAVPFYERLGYVRAGEAFTEITLLHWEMAKSFTEASGVSAQIDFQDPAGGPRSLRFANPVQVITAQTINDVRPAIRALEAGVAAGRWGAGFVSYEAAPTFDAALIARPASALPLLWFGLFDAPVTDGDATPNGTCTVSAWRPASPPEAHTAAVGAIREAITAGTVYQVNHTMRLHAEITGDSFALYRQLCVAQEAPYCAYLDFGPWQILSASPELFFCKLGDRIVTRPMKGTRPRGRWSGEDQMLREALAGSEKDRAENVMIVDLLRNDLGRIARFGSVETPSLFEIERYPTVWQMTSTVAATLQPGIGLEDILGALFPCGSVTGAPKVSAMRMIAGLEDSPRGAYCGAIGLLTPGGETTFSVAIRTVTVETATGRAEYGTGGGITADSDAAGEYAEAMAKATVLTETMPSFDLLETLRLEDGEYALRSRHQDRLLASAAYFGIPVSELAVSAALDVVAEAHPQGVWRVRLLVVPGGSVRTECAPLGALPPGPQRVALAETPVSRRDRFLFHKTTHRAVYETRKRRFHDVFDVLLWNEEGELTEFTIGNLVLERDGRLWTPPVTCGLLEGTLRAEMLAQGRIAERVLTRDDLADAARLWLLNSVRGWAPVTLTDSE